MGGSIAYGWRSLGQTSNGLWEKLVPTTEDFSRQIERAPRERVEREDRKTPSVDERDRYYRERLRTSSLRYEHRKDLERRGIVNPGDIAYSAKDGYLVPFRGVSGRYEAAQIRYDDKAIALAEAENRSLARYKWHPYIDGEYIKFNLPDSGELPVAVHPCENPRFILLLEGTGVKPILARSWAKDAIIIGVAGGLYASSMAQIGAILAQNPDLPIAIAPDAGDVINPHKVRALNRGVMAIRDLGRDAQLWWWGQTTKDEDDIDETTLAAVHKVDCITLERFEGIAKTEMEARGLIEQKPATSQPKGFARPEQPEDPIKEREKAIARRKFRFMQQVAFLAKDTEITDPTAIAFDGYASEVLCKIADDWATLLVRGGLGSGKTEALVRDIPKTMQRLNVKQVVIFVPRNGLGAQLGDRIEEYRQALIKLHSELTLTGEEIPEAFREAVIALYQLDVGNNRELLHSGKPCIMIMCPDSLKDYSTGNQSGSGQLDWSKRYVMIDEVNSVFKEIPKKGDSFLEFERMLRGAAGISAADAHASDADLRRLRSYRGSDRLAVLRQNFKKYAKKVHWIETRAKNGAISMRHQGISVVWTREMIAKGLRRFLIVTDSKAEAKILELQFKDAGLPTKLVCSETIDSNRAMLAAPDTVLKAEQIEVLIITPTAQSGLDVQTPFDAGYLHYTGTVDPLQAMQLMGRGRQCKEWWVSAARNTAAAHMVTNEAQLDKYAEALGQMVDGLNMPADKVQQDWAAWNMAIAQTAKAYHSEYLQYLIEQSFEEVDTVEMAGDVVTHKALAEAVHTQTTFSLCGGDIARGDELRKKEKGPQNDADFFSIALSQLNASRPTLTKAMLAAHAADDRHDILLSKILSDKKLDRLERYWAATKYPKEFEAIIRERLSRPGVTPQNPNYELLKRFLLFDRLALNLLVQLEHRKDKLEPNVNGWCSESVEVAAAYGALPDEKELSLLYPNIVSQAIMWDEIKRTLAYFGVSKVGMGNARTQTDELHSNGLNPDGTRKYSHSKSVAHTGFLKPECDGSEFRRSIWVHIEADLDYAARRSIPALYQADVEARAAAAKAKGVTLKPKPPDDW